MVKALKYFIIACIIGILYLICFNLFLKVASAGMRPAGGGGAVEGTAVLSTGEGGGTKFLREDGDGTSSWQAVPGSGGDLLADGTVPLTANWDVGNFGITMRDLIADFGVAGSTGAFTGLVSASSFTATNQVAGATGSFTGTLEGGTLTEGGQAVWNATETDIIKDTHIDWGTGAGQVSTADITEATDKKFVTDAQLIVIGNTSNTNTGDNTVATSGDSATAFFPSGTLEEGLLPDNATITGWDLGASTATTPSANDADTSLATTAFCETTQDYVKTSELAATNPIALSGKTYSLNYNTTNLLIDGAGKLAVGYDTTDFGVSGSSLTITDDAHAHTSTSISGLDISADTNLAVTNPIVKTDDTLSLNYATTNLLIDGTGKLAVGYNTSHFSVSGSSLQVTNDGHAHTTTSISGVDIGADTNLAGTANQITLTDDTLSLVLLKDVVATTPLTVNATTNVDNILPGADADLTFAITTLKDLVTTAPLTGGTNDIFPGADSDITVAISSAGLTSDGYLKGTDFVKFIEKDINFTITSPSNTYSVNGSSICIISKVPKAITITNIEVTCDANPTLEPVMDLKYADAFIGFANPVIINDCTTAAGVLSDSSITSGAVAAGKCIYLNLHAQPETAMKSMSFTISGVYQ